MVSDSEGLGKGTSGRMGEEGEEEQPSVSRHLGGGGEGEGEGEGGQGEVELQQQQQPSGGVQGVEEKSRAIDSVDSSRVFGSSRNFVNTDLSKAAEEAGPSSRPSSSSGKNIISDAGPSSPRGGGSARVGKVGIRIVDDEDSTYRLDEGRSSTGAERGRSRTGSHEENLLKEGDPPRHQEADDPSSREGSSAAEGVERGTAEAEGAVDTRGDQQFSTFAPTFTMPTPFPSLEEKSGEHFIDIPPRRSSKAEELDTFKRFGIPRTLSNFSRTSVESAVGDQCRICQQHTEEPLMELGCQCRGELAKAHRSCVDHWFGNKGTNKCEVCQHVATNVPLPSSQPSPHFWVWRVGGPYNTTPRRGRGARFHPLWAALLILIAGLLFDILISIFLGASALPVNIIIGVLVVLGLGTAARLVLECWHERVIRRNIRRMEEEPNFEDLPTEQNTNNTPVEPAEGQEPSNEPSPGTPAEQTAAEQGAAEASVTASVAATAAPDVENR